MMTLKFALITMMVGSNMLPMHMDRINTPMDQPKAQIEIVNRETLPATTLLVEEAVPVTSVEKKEGPAAINQDKTYEQCMNEAFERIYEEVNRLLDQMPDQTDEQFQLHRMM